MFENSLMLAAQIITCPVSFIADIFRWSCNYTHRDFLCELAIHKRPFYVLGCCNFVNTADSDEGQTCGCCGKPFQGTVWNAPGTPVVNSKV